MLVKGDILESNCNIICHQVNLQGVMGGGLAFQIAKKYPECEKQYKDFVAKNKDILGGKVFFYKIDDSHYIANCFSQNENFDTNYKWVSECANTVNLWAKIYGLETVAIPYGYGCGIANGNWDIVGSLWEKLVVDAELFKFLYMGKGLRI